MEINSGNALQALWVAGGAEGGVRAPAGRRPGISKYTFYSKEDCPEDRFWEPLKI
jgi:hypothetical protein